MRPTQPSLIIDLQKIKDNTRAVVDRASGFGVFGVTKGCAGSTAVARAMLDGGATGIADSRLPHLINLRQEYPSIPLMALRQPMIEEMAEVVRLDAIILVSDRGVVEKLGEAAASAGCHQKIVLMVEVGDGREGLPPELFIRTCQEIASHRALQLTGIAANMGCRGGRVPDRAMMSIVDDLVARARGAGIEISMVSAGNSSAWDLLLKKEMAASADHLRVGEAILLGCRPDDGSPITGLCQDAFTVRAEIIERSRKDGRNLIVLAIGCQDVGAGTLTPGDDGLKLTRLTSDHCVVEAERATTLEVGGLIEFWPSYLALQSLAARGNVRMVHIGYNNH